MLIETPRLTLRNWRETDRDAFRALHADAEVMADLGGPYTGPQADKKFGRYAQSFEEHGYTRWLIESPEGAFLGYAGVMPSRPNHPLGPHADIGWRLARHAWGHGYAMEAARAALDDAFTRVGLTQVLAYTAPDNLRSQAVMERLGLIRTPALDYDEPYRDTIWHGLVWVAKA